MEITVLCHFMYLCFCIICSISFFKFVLNGHKQVLDPQFYIRPFLFIFSLSFDAKTIVIEFKVIASFDCTESRQINLKHFFIILLHLQLLIFCLHQSSLFWLYFPILIIYSWFKIYNQILVKVCKFYFLLNFFKVIKLLSGRLKTHHLPTYHTLNV